MAEDDLNASLGTKVLARPPRYKTGLGLHALSGGRVMAGLLAAAAVTFAVLIATGDRLGGQPYSVVMIDRSPAPPARTERSNTPLTDPAPTGTLPAANADKTPSPAVKELPLSSAAAVEARSGVKVTRLDGSQTPASLVLQVQEAGVGVSLAPAPDKRLVEKARVGLLPKTGTDGTRPMDFYARPVLTSSKLKAGSPRIALIVGGMGLSATTTQSAMEQLPGEITLGFAPYGNELEKQVARARELGHEIILQSPMEPIDYPQNDPGPHTLLTSLAPAQNMDHLHWQMSRFQGYVGLANFLGGKFMAQSEVLSPMLQDIASRGLMFVDDGSAPQSLVSSLAPSTGLFLVKADIVIDATARADAIDKALGRLESLARDKGMALGTATGLPVSIDKIARFAKGLEARGIALVPVSSLAARSTGPTAKKE